MLHLRSALIWAESILAGLEPKDKHTIIPTYFAILGLHGQAKGTNILHKCVGDMTSKEGKDLYSCTQMAQENIVLLREAQISRSRLEYKISTSA